MKTKCANKKCPNSFHTNKAEQKYCSSNCQRSSYHREWFQKNKKPCPDCNNPIKRSASYCKPCAASHRSDHLLEMTLEEYVNCSTAPKHLPSKYNKIRSLARSQHKDLTKRSCAKCGYHKHVHICHIKPIHTFNNKTKIKTINSSSNIIQLCPNCHWELDNNLLVL
tara:strand:- start:7261 stop:7758 length:498 start_codon:yes stop_codon:yes gene_type:complete